MFVLNGNRGGVCRDVGGVGESTLAFFDNLGYARIGDVDR
jgi:hypothetical protein